MFSFTDKHTIMTPSEFLKVVAIDKNKIKSVNFIWFKIGKQGHLGSFAVCIKEGWNGYSPLNVS